MFQTDFISLLFQRKVVDDYDYITMEIETEMLQNSRDFLMQRLVTCRTELRSVLPSHRHSEEQLGYGAWQSRLDGYVVAKVKPTTTTMSPSTVLPAGQIDGTFGLYSGMHYTFRMDSH